jgi:hypothetical protein
MSLDSRSSARLLMIYYLLTPLFAAMDYFAGFEFRAAGLDSAGQRAGYYVLCTTLGLTGYYLPWLRTPLALTESTLNIGILIIGTYLGFLQAQEAIMAGSAAEIFSTQKLLTFLMSGGILLLGFHARMHDLHRTTA